MSERISLVRDFHDKYGVEYNTEPTLDVSGKLKEGLLRMLSEEVIEIALAIQNHDIYNLAKEFADLEYVLLGGIDMFGLRKEFPGIFEEVHKNNMSKKKKEIKLKNHIPGMKVEKTEDYEEVDVKAYLDGDVEEI